MNTNKSGNGNIRAIILGTKVLAKNDKPLEGKDT